MTDISGRGASKNGSEIAYDTILPDSVRLEENVRIGQRVLFTGGETVVRSGTVIEAAAVIGNDVTIGQGALIRAGAVVLNSVPPNAIVEGNPARIVGYRESANAGGANIVLRDASAFANKTPPTSLDLGIGGSNLYLMRRVSDPRGSLTVGEIEQDLPFEPKRYFIVFDVPSSELRGEHAHRRCHQFILCASGSCRVLLDDGKRRCEVVLDRPDLGVYMPPMVWGTQYRYSSDAVLLVFASHLYSSADYLRTYDEFLAELERCEV